MADFGVAVFSRSTSLRMTATLGVQEEVVPQSSNTSARCMVESGMSAFIAEWRRMKPPFGSSGCSG